jgi:hypothetical protein
VPIASVAPTALPAPTALRKPRSLPAQPTPLFGRDEELQTAREQLLSDEVRLLTRLGPGGVGKTCFAVASAESLFTAFPDGVWCVDLAPLCDPHLVVSAIAHALGILETEDLTTLETLQMHLADRRLLLVLDNLEHLLPTAPEIAHVRTARCTFTRRRASVPLHPGCIPYRPKTANQPCSLAIIELRTGAVTHRFPLCRSGEQAAGLALENGASGPIAYASVWNAGAPWNGAGERASRIAVLDGVTGAARPLVTLRGMSHGLTATRDHPFASNTDGDTLWMIDRRRGTVQKSVPVGRHPIGISQGM